MDWRALMRQLARFARDEHGGESVECALTSVVAAATAVVAQQAMTDGVSEFAARALDPPSRTD